MNLIKGSRIIQPLKQFQPSKEIGEKLIKKEIRRKWILSFFPNNVELLTFIS